MFLSSNIFYIVLTLVSVFVTSNCGEEKYFTSIEGLQINKLEKSYPDYNVYFFNENETLTLQCTIHGSVCDYGWIWNWYCDYINLRGHWQEVPSLFESENVDLQTNDVDNNWSITRTLRTEDHGKKIICSNGKYLKDKNVLIINVILIFDPARFLSPDGVTMDGFSKIKWKYVGSTKDNTTSSETMTYNYEYKFYDGEKTIFSCKKYRMPNFENEKKIEVETQQGVKLFSNYHSNLRSWDDNSIILTCTDDYNTTNVRTKLIWDPTDSQNSDSITMAGFAKDRWNFIKQNVSNESETYLFEYSFYVGEKTNLSCRKLLHNAKGQIAWKMNGISEKNKDSNLIFYAVTWNPSQHNKTLTCVYISSINQKILRIKTRLYWNFSHPDIYISSYDYIKYEGFDKQRLETSSDSRKYSIYHYSLGEILNLTCSKVNSSNSFSMPGYTKLIYDDNVYQEGETTAIDLKLNKIHDGQNLTCAYYMDDKMIDSQVVLLNEISENYGSGFSTTDIKNTPVSKSLSWLYGLVATIALIVLIITIFVFIRYYKGIKTRKNETSNEPFTDLNIDKKGSQITYASLELKCFESVKKVLKASEPEYSEVIINANKSYGGSITYENIGSTEYAEPAYCEVIK